MQRVGFPSLIFFLVSLSPYISLLSERWTLTPTIGAGYSPYGVFEGRDQLYGYSIRYPAPAFSLAEEKVAEIGANTKTIFFNTLS